MEEKQCKGSFEDLACQLMGFLEKSNYGNATIKRYQERVLNLRQRLGRKEDTIYNADVCTWLVTEILQGRSYSMLTRKEKELLRCANVLLELSTFGYIPFRSHKQSVLLQGEIGQLICAYIQDRRVLGQSERTIENTLLYLRRFQEYLETNGINDLHSLTSEHIFSYIRHLGFSTKSTIHCTFCALRGFFKHIHNNGIVVIDWSYLLPKDNYKREAKLPSTLDREEISRIIQSVDRGNPKGKRDYAMVLLAARLGLRASDICGLKFDQLLWEQNLIVLVQVKTQKRIELPLLSEVGNAIISYLKYGRPQSEEPYIFIQHIGPFKKMCPATLHSIISELVNRAGIKDIHNRKHGPHALRHSLAGLMLENKTPLPIISEALGHTSTESTMIYIKVDIQALRQCALDVPPLKSEFYREVQI